MLETARCVLDLLPEANDIMMTIIKHVLPEEQAEAMERIELFTERRGKCSGLLTDETFNTCFIT